MPGMGHAKSTVVFWVVVVVGAIAAAALFAGALWLLYLGPVKP
jgi:hypothetical protein